MERKIIRYSNRKLYDKTSKKYVNLEQLIPLINNGEEIQVLDHKTQKDITYSVLVSVLSSQLLTNASNNVNEIVNLIKKG